MERYRHPADSKNGKGLHCCRPFDMARPKRFELLTPWFVAKYSIQLSYGREGGKLYWNICRDTTLAEREGFEPSVRL